MAAQRALGAALLVAALGTGCGKSATVLASRYVDPTVGAHSGSPVCFAAVPANLGLAERVEYGERLDACTRAATAEGVAVASAPGCWRADLQWTSEPAGRSLADCEQEVAGYGCSASSIFRKMLRLRLTDPSTGQVGIDAITTLDSTTRSFISNTAFALCSAAFRHQPRVERSLVTKVALPN